jgi:hypothetical protein
MRKILSPGALKFMPIELTSHPKKSETSKRIIVGLLENLDRSKP